MDSSKLAERGGLVYYNKSDTPFSGKGIKYWPTGEVQIKATFEEGILIQSSFLGMDGSLLESTEVIDDTTISIEWFSNGGKRWESKTLLGKKIHINRWNEDGTKRKELFDWEKELLEPNDQWDIPLKYIIKKPTNNAGKQNVLYFMHAYMQSLPDYKHHVINQFGDNYITIILQAPYEISLASGDFSWFDFDISDNLSSLSSGTVIIPILGSIVQNGKLAACALLEFVSALKSVDLPTFGNPTMPHCKDI